MKPFVLKIDNQRKDNLYSLLTVAGESENLTGITVNKYTKVKKGITEISGDIVNGGRLYFVTTKKGAPKETVPTPNGPYYYGWIEFSKMPSDCSKDDKCQLWVNLSNVDITGLQLALSGIDTCERPFTCGYKSGATDTLNYLGGLFPGAVINTVTGQKKILAPDIVKSAYTSFDTYVESLVNSSAKMIILSDCASGFTNQLFTGSFQKGDVIVELKDVSGNTFQIDKTGLTNTIIYECDGGNLTYKGKYRKDNIDPTKVTGQTKQDYIVGNSLFRDIMIGLNEGYFIPSGTTDNRQFPNYETFKYGGNPYAKAIHQISNSYGFPYADSNLKVLITADVTSAVTVTICDDNTSVGYADKILPPCQPFNYTFAFGTGSVLGDVTVGGNTYKLDPVGKTFHGVLPEADDWTKIYFSGKTTYILYRTKPSLGAEVGSALVFSGTTNPVPATWVSAPYGWNLVFPGNCVINPKGTPPTSIKKSNLWLRIKAKIGLIFNFKN